MCAGGGGRMKTRGRGEKGEGGRQRGLDAWTQAAMDQWRDRRAHDAPTASGPSLKDELQFAHKSPSREYLGKLGIANTRPRTWRGERKGRRDRGKGEEG